MTKNVNGFVWLVVTDKAKEIFSSELFELYTLYDDDSEALIETFEDLNEALGNGLDIGIEVGHISIDEAKNVLDDNGYFTRNLWHVDDVKCFDTTIPDDECQDILSSVLENGLTMEQINERIGHEVWERSQD